MSNLRNRKIHSIVFSGLWILYACGPSIPASDLPALPEVKVTGYLPIVAEQVLSAQANVARKPTSAKANGHLGMLYRIYRDFDAAQIAFRRARMLAPGNPDWIYFHGEVLEQQGQIDESQKAMRELLALEPKDPPARLRLARLLIQQGNHDEATEIMQSLLLEAPQNVAVHMAQASLFERRGDLSNALDSLGKALTLAGSFGEAHYSSALLHRRLGQVTDARRHMLLFNKYQSVSFPRNDPRLARLFKLNLSDKPIVKAAQIAKAKGDNPRAFALLEQAMQRNPSNMETRAALIQGYAATSDYAKAEEHYELGKKIDPDHVEFQYAFARLLIAQARLPQASIALSEITGKAPQHALARAWLGYVLQLRGQTTSAGTELQKAFETDPQNTTARGFYARWLLRFADPSNAVVQLEKIAAVDGADLPKIFSYLSKAKAKAGDGPGAISALDQAIELAELLNNRQALSSLRNERRVLRKTMSGT